MIEGHSKPGNGKTIGNPLPAPQPTKMNPLKVKIKKLHKDAKVPRKAYNTDACYDIYATSVKDHGDGRIEYGTGLSMEIPAGTRVDLRPRSSIHKTGLMLSNSIGTGDHGYTGEYKAVFYHVLRDLPAYEIGDRILQMHIESVYDIQFEETDKLSESERGVGGYGSTGR